MRRLIAKSYDKIAKEYTEQHGYGEMLSIPALKVFLKYIPSRSTVLDVGCGGGQDSRFLADNGCVVFGIDVSREMIKRARKYVREASFRVVDLTKLSSKVKYDAIWCCRVFNHI